MKPFKMFSALFAIVFALTLTLPAGNATGPPAPKTEKVFAFTDCTSTIADADLVADIAFDNIGQPASQSNMKGLCWTASDRHYNLSGKRIHLFYAGEKDVSKAFHLKKPGHIQKE